MEVTEDNLEDLLACDDIFLDYFNVFLAASAFSIPLRLVRNPELWIIRLVNIWI